MIWHASFADRLASWNQLRLTCKDLAIESALLSINSWWFGSPWRPYYLHWDDQETWPDPWQLLSDNIYCEVARGLGILYTITLLERADLTSARLVLTESGDNLVLVHQTKYILNWEKDTIVNNNLGTKVRRQYQAKQIT